MKKRALAVCLLAAFLALSLAGCMQAVRLKERAIVQAVGVDYADGLFTLTIRYFVPEGSGGQEAFDASKSNNNLIRSQGETMTQAVEEAARLYGRQVFFGSNRLIILGEELARSGIRKVVDYFNANHQLDPSVYIFLADGDAAKIVDGKMESAQMEQMAMTATKHSHIDGGTMMDIVTRLEEGRGAVDVPILKLEGDEVRIEGSGLFRNQKLVDKLSEQEIRGILWFNGKAEKNVVVVELDDGRKASLEIISSSSKKRPRIDSAGQLVFDVEIRADSTLREVLSDSSGTVTTELVPQIRLAQEAKIRLMVHQAIEKAVVENHTDILGLGASIRKTLPEFYEANKDRLDEVIAGARFEIGINCNISRIGLESHDQKM